MKWEFEAGYAMGRACVIAGESTSDKDLEPFIKRLMDAVAHIDPRRGNFTKSFVKSINSLVSSAQTAAHDERNIKSCAPWVNAMTNAICEDVRMLGPDNNYHAFAAGRSLGVAYERERRMAPKKTHPDTLFNLNAAQASFDSIRLRYTGLTVDYLSQLEAMRDMHKRSDHEAVSNMIEKLCAAVNMQLR